MVDKAMDENFEDYKAEKNDLRLVPKNILKEFITTYRSHPALWQIKNKEIYNNKNLKNRGYSALVKVWKNYDSGADNKSIRLKIQSLRGSFRKELKKVENSKRSESGVGEDVYVSTLWYFNHLSFLLDHETPAKRIDDIEISNTSVSDAGKKLDLCEDELEINLGESNHSTSNGTPTPNVTAKKSKFSEEQEWSHFMSKCTAALDAKLNANEALGQYIICKLSEVTNPEQRMYAESLLTKVLNLAIMNKLHHSSDISVNRP